MAAPLLMQPNPKMLVIARDLHANQYARQKPLSYWDPLGLDADPIEVPGETIEIEGCCFVRYGSGGGSGGVCGWVKRFRWIRFAGGGNWDRASGRYGDVEAARSVL
jgi:hypothetical protein